ncbi:Uncharacterised protein [Pandoraea sputorum]|uniref:Uncharacterized protein n=1 Tax=Pandoraea sputorum TaxID=93222 RepID=A0A239SZB8_9BURK|nr:Uncharacterised protein [Pandoraea sputorum]
MVAICACQCRVGSSSRRIGARDGRRHRGGRSTRCRRRSHRRGRGHPQTGLRIEDERHLDRGIPIVRRHALDTPGELALHPIQLEAVGCANLERARLFVEIERCQRFDPGTELLRRELLFETGRAVLPEVVHAACVQVARGPSDCFVWRSYRPLSVTSDMGAERAKPSRNSVRQRLGDGIPAGIESDQRRIADVRHPTNHGAALGLGLARTTGRSGARRRQNPARYPHGGVTGTLLGKKLMGDFTAKASAKRVIHRNAHSTRISGRPYRVNPSDFARWLRK